MSRRCAATPRQYRGSAASMRDSAAHTLALHAALVGCDGAPPRFYTISTLRPQFNEYLLEENNIWVWYYADSIRGLAFFQFHTNEVREPRELSLEVIGDEVQGVQYAAVQVGSNVGSETCLQARSMFDMAAPIDPSRAWGTGERAAIPQERKGSAVTAAEDECEVE
ncbi:hypothetical protein DFH09DRAFT_1087028 [Mycena vulgaris]|nr:hypothetical protein DFH09DRAFT_1087028 [Mycena vulgaris]